jgi:hypothetical protein
VGLNIDRQEATNKFGQALVLARSDTILPDEWISRTRMIGTAKSKTFTPVLGTLLLAKATDDAVDALSLRADAGHKGYSARSLAKEVLVPCCVRAGIDLRVTGMEPLNSQPFLRDSRISTEMNVRRNSVADLAYLCETAERADFLRGQHALDALAAFLRVRIEVSAPATPIELGSGILDLQALMKALDAFVDGDSEGGKVGQAVATAILDLVFTDVRTKKVNDPSNTWPGDVGVFDRSVQILSAEVKQRAMTDAEVLVFAKRLHEAELHRGMIVALAQGRVPLDGETLAFQANRLSGVQLSFFMRAGTLLEQAATFATQDTPLTLGRFPRLVMTRLDQLEVSEGRRKEWARLFSTPSPSPKV